MLDDMPTDEALVNFAEVQRKYGTTEQFAFVFDAADTFHMHRRSFPCVASAINPRTFPYTTARQGVPLTLVEELY